MSCQHTSKDAHAAAARYGCIACIAEAASALYAVAEAAVGSDHPALAAFRLYGLSTLREQAFGSDAPVQKPETKRRAKR